MLYSISIKNCFAIYHKIIFNMEADADITKFKTNVYKGCTGNVLKTIGIFGQNNVGKTCFIKTLKAVCDILLNKGNNLMPNIFHEEDTLAEFEIIFEHKNNKYKYSFSYDYDTSLYNYEKFVKVNSDNQEDVWLLKDVNHDKYMYNEINALFEATVNAVSPNNLLCYNLSVDKFPLLSHIKNIISEFASKFDFVNMNNIPMEKTIELLKNHNNLQEKVVEFVKSSDLYLEDYKYDELRRNDILFESRMSKNDSEKKPDEKVLNIPEQVIDKIALTSVYKGISVPSILFDSTGTKKIAALASYIIEGLEKKRIVIVDELDSSIHFRLTRAIVNMFNNELNAGAQLIFTAHDVSLIDCDKMMRREQIWFMHKDISRIYMYSLNEITKNKKIKDEKILDNYKRGVLGAIPNPNLLISILPKSGIEEVDGDE